MTPISTRAEYRRRDYHMARTQREAGLEYVAWGERLKPLRPWASDILAGIGLIVFCIAAFVLSSAAAEWLR